MPAPRLASPHTLGLVLLVAVLGGCTADGGNTPLAPITGMAGGAGGVGAGGAGGGFNIPGRDGGTDAPGFGTGGRGGTAIGDMCATLNGCGPGKVCAVDVAGGGYCTADCTNTGTCPAGSACVGDGTRICVKTCGAPFACRAEHVCTEGYCVPRCTQNSDCSSLNCNVATGVCGDSRVGLACLRDTDCGAHPAFCDKTHPQGYCSTPCGGPMNVSCPDEATCSSNGSAGVCLRNCTGPADCRTGLLCARGAGGVSTCAPRCMRDEDCAAGLRCDASAGACVEGGPGKGMLGGACASAADCTAVGAGAFCATGLFPGGYCSRPCENSPCPETATCVPGRPPSASCLSRCTTPADCRSGYTCFSLPDRTDGVCFPRCTADADCDDPALVCDETSGHCVPTPVGAPTMTNGIVDLTPNGPVNLAAEVPSDRFIVTVPADAVSISFFGQAVGDLSAELQVARLEQSTNDFATATRLYDAGSLSNPVSLPPALIPGSFSVLHPNSPAVPFTRSAGGTTAKLAIRVISSKPTAVKVSAIVKTSANRVLTQGQLDLNLFFVGVPELNAASAKTDPRFKQMFDITRSIWAKAGIGIGTVNYIDITGADEARFSDLDVEEIGALMTRTSHPAARDNALNIFFVHSITGDTLNGFVILGLSAGIPGVPIRGTTGSGLAITSADFPMGVAEMADTWAHEGGHFLGLFHATESSGAAFDPLPDTPQCPRIPNDTNADRIMQPRECTGRGAENVMFWTSAAGILNGNMSGNQSFVLLRNPAVR